jgi:hypothetical protein
VRFASGFAVVHLCPPEVNRDRLAAGFRGVLLAAVSVATAPTLSRASEDGTALVFAGVDPASSR